MVALPNTGVQAPTLSRRVTERPALGMLPAMDATLQERFARLGLAIPQLLLPRPEIDLSRWAVIACDQHTSEPDYWQSAATTVGDAPSTLKLVFPEVYLDAPDATQRIADIHRTMAEYRRKGILREQEPGLMMVERSTPHVPSRTGLLAAVDLELYDYTPGSNALIRASEKTILERLPPRVRIRRGAPIELPHVLVLYNDPDHRVDACLADLDSRPVYETSLMLGGGSVSGTLVTDEERLTQVAGAFEQLLKDQPGPNPLLFAVGDGNHSLAAAKTLWDELRDRTAKDHPARWALVELVNLYDPGLRFEPIHRIVTGVEPREFIAAMTAALGATATGRPPEQIEQAMSQPGCIGFLSGGSSAGSAPYSGVIELPGSEELPVSTVQEYLNAQTGTLGVDYIHGHSTAATLAQSKRSVALIMPPFNPQLLYPTVQSRGVLPRKAFSLGEAEEKRYYLEARRIDAD